MAQQNGPADDALLARGMSGPHGKFDREIKFHVDELTFDKWLRVCASKDVTSSELGRDMVYLVAWGRTPAEIVGDDRRAMLNQTGLGGKAT